MLRINLLPVRQLKKRARAQKELLGLGFLFLTTLVLLFFVAMWLLHSISNLESDKKSLTVERTALEPQIARLKALKAEMKELERKTNIIKKLRSEASLTVRVMNEVANRVDSQRMWLTSLQQSNTNLTITGIALDNQTVAQFMDALLDSDFVVDVSLANSSMKVISGRNLKSFVINCIVTYPEKYKKKSMQTGGSEVLQ
ncbi:PilN domain-containing protein [Desulforhopalus vacuolatus]|uniref:PilN domain-containing protein n=1 Tax=Desulforhopalus vacuolatus TaxID=40414 RepID=UPI001963C1C7|nr:PilN domain-containing protein [Desulforhopalus vacuolatus]MBM9519677.1 PilN domain-containing protein [Desulforhopalus vacuolatus]